MTIEDGVKFCLKIFKEVLGKNFDVSRFDLGYVKIKEEKLVRMHGDALKKFAK